MAVGWRQHEFNEGGRIGGLVSHAKDSIVFLLMVTDDAFHREEDKDRPPVSKDEGLPESPILPFPSSKGWMKSNT